MFRSQAMSRVELIIPEQDVIPVTEALAASGAFHPILSRYVSVEEGASQTGKWHDWINAFSALERRLLDVMEALDVDEGPPPATTPHLIEPGVALLDVEQLERETRACIQELNEEQEHLGQLLDDGEVLFAADTATPKWDQQGRQRK